jgi:hypothetical protein
MREYVQYSYDWIDKAEKPLGMFEFHYRSHRKFSLNPSLSRWDNADIFTWDRESH